MNFAALLPRLFVARLVVASAVSSQLVATRDAGAQPEPRAAGEVDREWAERDRLVGETTALNGAAGLLHTVHASSGEVGQFRLSFNTDFFAARFLCSAEYPCPNPRGGGPIGGEQMSHVGGTVALGVTLARLGAGFLEAFASTSAYANSDDAARPALLQVVGDTAFGAKYGAPLAKTFWLAGFAEVLLVNGNGAVGLSGKSTSMKFGPAATLDLRRSSSRTPLRFSLNAFYFLDNSASAVEAVEAGRGRPVSRVERFGVSVNRLDQIGGRFGAEAFVADDRIRPFAEYQLGILTNRQGYKCVANNPSSDKCFANEPVIPSTLTVGARFFPWQRGFSILAAVDVGIGGTSTFIEELAPTPPWKVFVGLGWAFDTKERPPVTQIVTKTVPVPVEAPRLAKILGFVHERDKPAESAAIADAIVTFKDHPELTPLATTAEGRFKSPPLEHGEYTLTVRADGYKPGECATRVSRGGADVTLDCAMEALPRVGGVVGLVRDAETSALVPGVTVKLVDEQKQPYSATTETAGSFRFEKLAPGMAEIQVQADGYLAFVQQAEVKVRQETRVEIALRPKPRNAAVQITAREIVIKQQVQFANDSAVIKPESFALLTEVADTMIRNPRIQKIEVQGHTDDLGPADYNKTLSQQRADAVRLWLTQHGVEAGRLVGVGYGKEKPLVPNAGAANRARNRRVQFIILAQEPATRAP